MGGTLEVSSIVGTGSVFEVVLPLQPDDEVPVGPEPARLDPAREPSRSTATTSG